MWIHVSREYLGINPVIKPKIPGSVTKNFICRSEEGDIPRICVSTNIIKCINGITGNCDIPMESFVKHFPTNPCVYITDEIPYIPPNCSDFRYNDEHWFITPTKFYFLGRIDIYKLLTRYQIEKTEFETVKFPTKKVIVYREKVKSKFLECLKTKLK
jgi:hypothetical protein